MDNLQSWWKQKWRKKCSFKELDAYFKGFTKLHVWLYSCNWLFHFVIYNVMKLFVFGISYLTIFGIWIFWLFFSTVPFYNLYVYFLISLYFFILYSSSFFLISHSCNMYFLLLLLELWHLTLFCREMHCFFWQPVDGNQLMVDGLKCGKSEDLSSLYGLPCKINYCPMSSIEREVWSTIQFALYAAMDKRL